VTVKNGRNRVNAKGSVIQAAPQDASQPGAQTGAGGVTRFRPGDEVYFCDGGFGSAPGTYAKAKILDERLVAGKPKRLSFTEAAAAPW